MIKAICGEGLAATMGNLINYAPGTPAWIDLGVRQVTTADSRFYCGLFGWSVMAWHRPLDDAAGYWIFQKNGRDVAGMGPSEPSRWGQWGMCISVVDGDAAAQTIADNGGHIIIRPRPVFDAGRLALFTDPLGAHIAIWEPNQHTGVDVRDEPSAFTWSELWCRDIDKAKTFYNAVFGWEAKTSPVPRGADGSGAKSITEFFVPGIEHCVAGMVECDEAAPGAPLPHWMLYFQVDDTDAIAARASQLGGSVDIGPFDRPDYGRLAALRDPAGASFGILERSAAA